MLFFFNKFKRFNSSLLCLKNLTLCYFMAEHSLGLAFSPGVGLQLSLAELS